MWLWVVNYRIKIKKDLLRNFWLCCSGDFRKKDLWNLSGYLVHWNFGLLDAYWWSAILKRRPKAASLKDHSCKHTFIIDGRKCYLFPNWSSAIGPVIHQSLSTKGSYTSTKMRGLVEIQAILRTLLILPIQKAELITLFYYCVIIKL